MNMEIFEKMSADELKKYIGFLLWHYRVMDSFWFIELTEEFGQETAERINERVWGKIAGMAAKRIRDTFGIDEKGLEGFVKTQKLFPWCIMVDYQIEETDDGILLTVPQCPTQMARLKRGLGEYVCKEMHRGEFTSFCQAIDPRIEIECLFAPPDEHPEECFCQWKFTVKEK